MDTTKVIIENLPHTPWFIVWVPIIIAVISLVTSIISLYWTRVQYEKSSRPFVWASNYGVVDHLKNTIIPIPWRVAFRVKNTPAKIIKMTVVVKNDSNELINYRQDNLIRFPDKTSEWTFDIGKHDFNKLMNLPDAEKVRLLRIVSIHYSSIDGGKIYKFLLKQNFNPAENQWKDIYEEAN
ncbi:hypothetical protein VJY32_11705 [Ignavibacteria bacterium 4148-Me]|uniref:hypothetical protein n=1 Tax=Rosettibacter primus TaxID=3111523 RepID=UPI00336C10E1